MTYSIVARDARTGDLAVAVQSKFMCVGSIVPWARAGVGAVAFGGSARVGVRQAEVGGLADDSRHVC